MTGGVAELKFAVAANEEDATLGTHLAIYRETTGTSILDEHFPVGRITKIDVPFIEGGFALQDVLSRGTRAASSDASQSQGT